MGKQNVQALAKEEDSSPFVFFAAFTFILAVIGVAASGLGVLGLLNYPQVDFLNHSSSLFCTSVGGVCAVIFLVSGLIFSHKAEEQIPREQQIKARSFQIKRGENELRIVTKRFQQRLDLLNALSKDQKFDCLESGQWALHEDEEGDHFILGKFSYLVNADEEKRCRVRLKVLPFKESASSTNVYYNKKNKRLMLLQNGELLPFRGATANNYLMQKAWIFSGRNFDSMISA
ncbi:MAG: hypothetical protein H7A36_07220 [Chlamydiales bacterium]|nr:hypothetical protein [Chlamydiales bacterium]